ncbi:SRPBCC family protein [uncultured Dokdonia sp.]|uniref:SRPBCC family protein n=1 Tax=uncultured Dokdonia sp. TaxID=575653 RepID=UPI00263539EA|nr:SRPBCC family protein [uncultured Dokdonia sp.]
MMILIYIVATILVIIIILAAIAPKTYQVSRSIVIDKPKEIVFPYVKMVKNQDHWSPWKRKDPDMKQTYTGTDGEVGFKASWKGNKDVGEGSQTITAVVENERIDNHLIFLKPWKSESDGYYTVEDAGAGQTKVVWGFKGQNKFPATILMLFINMDKVVGKDFEEGLQNLKIILEA